jgi:hypothetical protein
MGERIAAKPLFRFVSPENNQKTIASVLGVPRTTIRYWDSTNAILVYRADELCCKRLKVHPAEVWDEWFEVAGNG